MSSGSLVPQHLLKLERGQAEYSCLWHPRSVGGALDDVCTDCGRPFGFGLGQDDVSRPKVIGRRNVVKGLGRGFYGMVFKTEHERMQGTYYASKLISVAAYSPSPGGYDKSIDQEVRLLKELASAGIAPRISDHDLLDVSFGDITLTCHLIEMEYLDGDTLKECLEESALNPREIAQVSCDMLNIIGQLQQRGRNHNDLHAENVLIGRRAPTAARGGKVIDSLIDARVLDLGAGGSAARGDARLTDTQWVAKHLSDLLDRCEATDRPLEPDEQRLCSQLRRVADYLVGTEDGQHQSDPNDIQDLIRDAYSYGRAALQQPVKLAAITGHINARTMPPWFTPELLYDPDGKWAQELVVPGTHLVYGMRGCGKTMLLRSLEWAARSHPRRDEPPADAAARAAAEDFLGLWLSCSSLLKGARAELVDAPLHRVFLAFAREGVLAAESAGILGLGEADYHGLEALTRLVAETIPWFEPPADFIECYSLERALLRALRASSFGDLERFTTQQAFDDLAASLAGLHSQWRHKRILYMLDDLSARFLKRPALESLISQLCIDSTRFGFKISTENHNLALQTQTGQLAQAGRDYIPFDLGNRVYEQLGRKGLTFVQQILNRRLRVIPNHNKQAREVLGTQSLKALSAAINAGQPVLYWGVQALASICVGDISDILRLYQDIESRGERMGKPVVPVPASIQHDAAVDFATSKVQALLSADRWLHEHALAFARASSREGLAEERRTYSMVNIQVADSDSAQHILERILQLVDSGVYVMTGGTSRSKIRNGSGTLNFQLAFRKLFGLPYRMPLGRRDRFEFRSVADLESWLEQPTPEGLNFGIVDEIAAYEELPATATGSASGSASVPLADEQLNLFVLPDGGRRLPQPRKALGATAELVPRERLSRRLDWSKVAYAGAYGFEQRGLASWSRMLAYQPAAVYALEYPTPPSRGLA